MTKEHVGARLRAVRERLGWSVRETARRASLSDTLCHKIEHLTVTPGIETLESLASALGVPDRDTEVSSGSMSVRLVGSVPALLVHVTEPVAPVCV